jgi:hypothetical protein
MREVGFGPGKSSEELDSALHFHGARLVDRVSPLGNPDLIPIGDDPDGIGDALKFARPSKSIAESGDRRLGYVPDIG